MSGINPLQVPFENTDLGNFWLKLKELERKFNPTAPIPTANVKVPLKQPLVDTDWGNIILAMDAVIAAAGAAIDPTSDLIVNSLIALDAAANAIQGNFTGPLVGNVTGTASNNALKPVIGTYGGVGTAQRTFSWQSDTTSASANNPAVAGGAGAFTVTVGSLAGYQLQSLTAEPGGSTATLPKMAVNLAFNSLTGEITGLALEWTGVAWQAAADGTRVQVQILTALP